MRPKLPTDDPSSNTVTEQGVGCISAVNPTSASIGKWSVGALKRRVRREAHDVRAMLAFRRR